MMSLSVVLIALPRYTRWHEGISLTFMPLDQFAAHKTSKHTCFTVWDCNPIPCRNCQGERTLPCRVKEVGGGGGMWRLETCFFFLFSTAFTPPPFIHCWIPSSLNKLFNYYRLMVQHNCTFSWPLSYHESIGRVRVTVGTWNFKVEGIMFFQLCSKKGRWMPLAMPT